jgi:hypothetical protein
MKRNRRVILVGARVGERPNDVEELHDRAGPPVDEHQGHRVGVRGTHVQEVDVLTVNGRDELWNLVQPRLGGRPVVASTPVLGQVPHVCERNAALPGRRIRQLIGPAGTRQPFGQVIEVPLRDLDSKGAHAVGVHV